MGFWKKLFCFHKEWYCGAILGSHNSEFKYIPHTRIIVCKRCRKTIEAQIIPTSFHSREKNNGN